MHAIPVMVVISPAPGLLTVNGHMVCQVDGAASLPVGPSGDVFLLFTPYGDYLPVAQRFSFYGGRLVSRDGQVKTTSWPDGVVEVELVPRRMYAYPPRLIDSVRCDGVEALLYKDDAITLVAVMEDTQEKLFELRVPEAVNGSLRALDMPQATIGALLEAQGMQRLLLLRRDGGGLSLLADVSGDKLHLDAQAGRITSAKALDDTAGHGEVCLYQSQGGIYALARREYVLGGAERAMTPQEKAAALLEAVALGLEDEAMSYLSPAYAEGLTYAELTMFLGAFDGVEKARYHPGGDGQAYMALTTRVAENSYLARVFAFESDQDGICSIKRYDG